MRKQMKKNDHKRQRSLRNTAAVFLAAVTLVSGLYGTGMEVQAKATYDTKHTKQLSFEDTMTGAFSKNMNADVVYQEMKRSIQYGALSEGDIRHLYENMDTNIQAEVITKLFTEGLISSYLYKILMGGNLTAADLAEVYNAVEYADLNPDVRDLYGYDENMLFQHFLLQGLSEGRISSKAFNIQYYKANYPDLAELFGDQNGLYYQHYLMYGKYEGRIADKLKSAKE